MNAQTTIRRLADNTEVTININGNRNSRYISRTFILHNDGETYDYIHEYIDKIPSKHYGKRSRRIWNRMNRLLEENLEFIETYVILSADNIPSIDDINNLYDFVREHPYQNPIRIVNGQLENIDEINNYVENVVNEYFSQRRTD